MAAMNRLRILRGLAVAAAVAGILLAIYAVRGTPEWLRRLAAKRADLAALRRLESVAADQAAVVRLFDALPESRPAPLRELIDRQMPGVTADVRPRESVPVAAGWSARTVDVVFENAALADIARFIGVAADGRPPWRVREFSISSSAQKPGAGRVSLLLEAMEKTGGGK